MIAALQAAPVREIAMAKGQMRGNKEKKKPKAEWNKKKKGAAAAPHTPSAYAATYSQAKPAYNPYGKKS
jgi:hypothetical protein